MTCSVLWSERQRKAASGGEVWCWLSTTVGQWWTNNSEFIVASFSCLKVFVYKSYSALYFLLCLRLLSS
ncbi:hypothetical protein ATANTOWER_015373 [Ataeniobius toweri]|uniref:Uncharacterized protein n=1 Tax=Ataeniobius toweri TaxID=208326 RepID=A0ABU7CBE0_9TELE|nr:hypothetical protein [Ataeniobius toweri]